MRFFLPFARDNTIAESAYGGIKKFAEENMGWKVSGRRIYSMNYTHHSKPWKATVGEDEPRTREKVVAILETDQCFLICTPTRGVLRDIPIMVGRTEAERVTDFESVALLGGLPPRAPGGRN